MALDDTQSPIDDDEQSPDGSEDISDNASDINDSLEDLANSSGDGVQPRGAAPMNPVLRQHLYSLPAMKAAQVQADQNAKYAGLARAGAFLAAGLAGSNQQVNQQPFDQLDAEAQAPVNNILNQQKSATNNLKIQEAESDAQRSQDAADPNSVQSVASRNLIKKLYPGKFDDATLDKLSAADIGDSVMKPLELDQKIQASKQAHEDNVATRNQASIDRAQAKADIDHEKYVQHIEDKEMGWRSDPASTRYDAMIGAATTGKAMIDKYRGHEDDMPIQDIHALVSDRLKAITGATPTEQEIAAQMPNTLKTKWGGLKSFVTGSPEPAGAGDFVKMIDSSFQDMEQKAQEGLRRRQESVASSPRLSPDEKARLVQTAVPERAYGAPAPAAAKPPGQAPGLQDAVAAEIQRRAAAKAQGTAAATPPPQPQPGQEDPGFAYGGMVGGLPSSNFAAAQMEKFPKVPALHLHNPRGYAHGGMVGCNYADGGQVPGNPKFPFETPANDQVVGKLTPKEVVLPLHVTQAKNPAMAAYLYMKNLMGQK